MSLQVPQSRMKSSVPAVPINQIVFHIITVSLILF